MNDKQNLTCAETVYMKSDIHDAFDNDLNLILLLLHNVLLWCFLAIFSVNQWFHFGPSYYMHSIFIVVGKSISIIVFW